MKYTHDTWAVDLPANWEPDETDEGMAFYNPDGVGAMQIFSYLVDDGEITQEDLVEFSESETTEDIDLPYLKGVTNIIEEGDDIFINWWLRSGSELFYVSYVCEKGNEAIEADEREHIVASLKPIHD